MVKKDYISTIEKTAALNVKSLVGKGANKVTNTLLNNPVKTGLGVSALTAGATAYPLLDKEDRTKFKGAVKKGARTVIDTNINGGMADAVRKASGAAGVGVALLKGKRGAADLAKSGLKGYVLGDIGGSAVVPAIQIKRQANKDLGRNPTAKEYARAVVGNAIGPTALWAGMYGLKSGRKKLKKITSSATHAVNSFKTGQNNLKNDLLNYSRRNPGKDFNMKNLLETEQGKKILNRYKGSLGEVGKGLVGAAAPIMVADEVASIPTYFSTPKNILSKSKADQERE